MRIRKLIVLVLVFVFIVVGCTKEEPTTLKDKLIKKVEILEKSRIAGFTHEISAKDFEKNIEGIYNKALEEEALEGMKEATNEENIQDYLEYYEDNGYKLGRMPLHMFYYLSKDELEVEAYIVDELFEGTFEGEKRVNLKRFTKYYYKGELIADSMSIFSFNFKDIDGEWRITEIRGGTESLEGLDQEERELKVKSMPFYKSVDYIELYKISK